MPETIGPAIARDRLSARLRELRASQGLSPAEVAERLHWPESAIEEMESGRSLPSPRKLEDLLGLYGVEGLAAENLFLLDHIARSRFWWARHGMSEAYQDFVAYEAEAGRICIYQPLVVPGLLQTRRYAVAAAATILGVAEDDPAIVARADVRLERQGRVADRVASGERVEFVAIVDEVVLRRRIGGDDVMREQLGHLAEQAGLPHVTLVVLPTALGGHPGLGGVFELLEHESDPGLSTVFIESATDDQILRGAAVGTYRQIVTKLRSTGLAGDDAVALVREIHAEI
ncbi:helix-turn-helix domain-containing protein [Actinoplanes sp. CA-142083]|uniref:helix-turn-helix domain-containing protein n=1 Tax=Actinoplanes sp. CA-142083 TaxID=3239903 RepID=UPI003D937F3B